MKRAFESQAPPSVACFATDLVQFLVSINTQLGMVVDLYRPVWKSRNHVEFAAHGIDVAAQGRQVHVSPLSIIAING